MYKYTSELRADELGISLLRTLLTLLEEECDLLLHVCMPKSLLWLYVLLIVDVCLFQNCLQ
jgi:hypothetical protein